MQKNNKICELKKHVYTIHCSNNLTLVQRKLCNALLYHAYDELMSKSRFQIYAKDLCQLIGYNSHDYKKLKEALFQLMHTVIEWDIGGSATNNTFKTYSGSTMLSAVSMKNGICDYQYSDILKELLYHPEIYGCIDMSLVPKFKSSYGLALYENCVRYQNLKSTPWFRVSIFRKLMGVSDDKYAAFCDFKKRVLAIAINEVNGLAPIFIEPEISRQKQKVVSIRFKINKQLPSVIKQDAEKLAKGKGLASLLGEMFFLSSSSITRLFSEYREDYIQEKIEMIRNSASYRAGRIKDLSGYLVDALRNDYRSSKSSNVVMSEERRDREEELKQEKIYRNEKEKQYSAYLKRVINKYLSSLSELEQEKLIGEFVNVLKSTNIAAYGWYKEKQFNHVAMKPLYHNFIMEKQSQGFGVVLSKEDFFEIL